MENQHLWKVFLAVQLFPSSGCLLSTPQLEDQYDLYNEYIFIVPLGLLFPMLDLSLFLCRIKFSILYWGTYNFYDMFSNLFLIIYCLNLLVYIQLNLHYTNLLSSELQWMYPNVQTCWSSHTAAAGNRFYNCCNSLLVHDWFFDFIITLIYY